MIYFDRIDASEGTGVNKTSKSKVCDICHYWYFLNKGFKFKSNAYNGYHDSLIMSLSLSDIATLSIKGVDYHCIISRYSKNEAKKMGIKMGTEILMSSDIEIEKERKI